VLGVAFAWCYLHFVEGCFVACLQNWECEMKVLRGQLSEAVGKQDEDDVKIKEFNVGVSLIVHLSSMPVFCCL